MSDAASRAESDKPLKSGGVSVEEDVGDSDSEDAKPAAAGKPRATFTQVGEMTPEEAIRAREATFQKAQQAPQPELSEEEKAAAAAAAAEAKAQADSKAAKAKARAEADKLKTEGNTLYKARKFPEAVAKYEAAIAADPTNIVYYNNLVAVFLEQKEFQKAIDSALQGVAVGKEAQANYVDVAKAYARVASAYQSLGDIKQAIEFYNKSLIEDYNDKTKLALKKLEEERVKQEQLAYIDPAKSEEHKAKGNTLYNAGKFIDAIQEYNEAIKRDPKNYKVYSNRAACYTKLMDWQRGLDDCEKCLAMDPKFVKAYIRKGKIQHFLKQFHKALTTFDQALEIDPGNTEVLEAKRETMIKIQTTDSDPERAKEAMKDPEIQQILRDPTISKVLSDLQTSPSAGQAAMRDPDIRKKIEKLIAAGVLGVK